MSGDQQRFCQKQEQKKIDEELFGWIEYILFGSFLKKGTEVLGYIPDKQYHKYCIDMASKPLWPYKPHQQK